MRLKNIPLLACFWILVFLIPNAQLLVAQSEAEGSEGTLYIHSKKGEHDVAVPQGTSVSVRYRHNPKVYHGLEMNGVLRDTSVVLGSDTVGIQFIDEIGVRREKLYHAGKVVFWWSVIAIAAVIVLSLIVAALAFNPGILMVILAILLILVAIPASVALPWGLITGVILMAVAKKRYRLYKDYQLSSKPSGSVLPK